MGHPVPTKAFLQLSPDSYCKQLHQTLTGVQWHPVFLDSGMEREVAKAADRCFM